MGRSGLSVSRVGLGTMTWGRGTDQHEAADQLRLFLDAGGTLIDTAFSYSNGEAERLLGQLLPGTVDRDRLVLATKGGIDRRTGARAVNTSRRVLLDQLDASLRRLGSDHVDLWQVHVWSENTPLEETLGALDDAVSSGRVRYVGISNYAGWQTGAAVMWQRAWPGRAPLVSTQVEYSLLARVVEREVLPAAAVLGLGVFPWSPLGAGVLTGKYRSGTPADSRGASDHFVAFVEKYADEHSQRVVDAVATAADGLGVSATEVALAWVRDSPGVTAPIVGARTAAQLRQSLSAERLTLPPAIRSALDDVSAIQVGYPER